MSRPFATRLVVGALIVVLTYSPLLGGLNGTVATAQTAQNTTSSYVYDLVGNRTQVTDPLGRVSNVAFDALNRPMRITDPVPATGVARPVTLLGYDGRDQLAYVTDPRSLTTNYTVDGLGKQTRLTSPDTSVATMTLDVAGNLLTKTDARGKVTTFTYDALNRVTRIAYTTGTASVFEYDGGSTGSANDIGHLTRMTDESGQTTFSYDGMGRLLSKVQTTSGTNGASAILSMSYVYGTAGSAAGKLASVTYPSGNRINYTYDAAGRVSGLTLNPSDLAGGTNTGTTTVLLSDISYSPFGPAQSWTWGNSTPSQANTYARTFDLDGRMTSYPLGNPAAGGLVRTLAYDAASRITSMTHTGAAGASSFDQTFGYDGLDRLTSFTSSTASLGYSYDASGNRTQLRIGAATYNNTIASDSNRLSSTAGPAPNKTDSFDAAGNTTGDGIVSYTYSDRGRLKRSTKASVMTDYLYNAVGQRVSKTGTTTTTGVNFYVYDEQGHLAGEYTAGGAPIEETVYLGDTPVAVLNIGGANYIYADHINTPRVITNSADSAIVWRWDLTDPFGSAAPNENPFGAGTFSYNPRFPGQLFDAESGLHYNYFRDYDPQTGRYIRSDPIGLAGGINTYGYVGGRPLTFADPTGQIAITSPIVIGGGLIACYLTPGCRDLLTKIAKGLAGPKKSNPLGNESDDSKTCPPPADLPDFDWHDPTVPPVGPDGESWPWRGPDKPGGPRGGYVNPSNPDQSAHPDLNHPAPVGPHWDYTDRKNGGYRVYPDGTVRPK